MIVLKKSTFAKMERSIKYPSITGGRGVRLDRQPGGGLSLSIPPVTDGGGIPIGGGGGAPPEDPPPDLPYVWTPWLPPYDPHVPDRPS